MRSLLAASCTTLGLLLSAHSLAQDATDIPRVKVEASRLITELPYRHYLEIQHQLHRYLPPEPHLVDLWFRIGYPRMHEPERDARPAAEQGVVVRSRSVDETVTVRRGAYFSLPAIQAAYDESGEILLNGVGRGWLGIWWTLRVPDDRRMRYADIRDARDQLTAVQHRISAFANALRTVKREPYDGIKACFHDDSGAILIGGQAVADAVEGHCKIHYSDPARAADEVVEFSGPLDAVSFIDRRYYQRKGQD